MTIDRFTTPLYGIAEAAGYLAVPASTFTTWAFGYRRRQRDGRTIHGNPVITAARPGRPNEAAVPFIGLAEGYALATFRQAGVPLQRIRPAIDALQRELGLAHALASHTRWIEDSAKQGWAVLMKDKRIHYRRAEIDAVIEHQARCFVITRGDLTSAAYAERFIANQRTVFSASNRPGPFIHAVHADRLEPLYP